MDLVSFLSPRVMPKKKINHNKSTKIDEQTNRKEAIIEEKDEEKRKRLNAECSR